MVYFHVPSPLLNELNSILKAVEADRKHSQELSNRATVALLAMNGINVHPSEDNGNCVPRTRV